MEEDVDETVRMCVCVCACMCVCVYVCMSVCAERERKRKTADTISQLMVHVPHSLLPHSFPLSASIFLSPPSPSHPPLPLLCVRRTTTG